MKRILPVIIILISLSLLGLILLQVSWFNNLLEVTTSQVYGRVKNAGIAVSSDLSKTTYAGKVLRLSRRGGLSLGTEFQLRILKTPTVYEKFALEEVNNKIKAAFEKEDLKKLKFEFAITNANDDYEMFSNGYEKEFWDTVNNKRFYYAIVPPDAEPEISPGFEKLILILPDAEKQIWASLRWVILGAILFTIVIVAAFYVTVRTLFNQKKLSQIKSDFINNMTHELKTPLATISLAVDALKNEKVLASKDKMSYFNNIIKEENTRMNKHVETILQAATMEKQELKLNVSPIVVHAMIEQAIDNFKLQLQDKGGNFQLLLNAKNDTINGDEVHFFNLISNLIDNAIKYSKDTLELKISTHSTKNYFVMRFEDNGIGMSKETVKRIFEKFYRAHTGNVHNVKGFGLGMSYAKQVVDAHKGRIKVESVLGKGSSFTVEVPLG
jgi:two-component system, OmpR family, phosphate regulon sensor histidine kinase PhoR